MKKLLLLLLIGAMCISAVGCTGKTEEDTENAPSTVTEQETPPDAPQIDILPIQEAMLAAAPSLPEMLTLNSNDEDPDYAFSYLCDIDYSKVGAYFLSYSTKATSDEIAVIYLNNKNDIPAVTDALKEHIEDRIKLFSTYAPDEVTRLESSLVFSEGNYVVLIVCDNASEVKNAFYSYEG